MLRTEDLGGAAQRTDARLQLDGVCALSPAVRAFFNGAPLVQLSAGGDVRDRLTGEVSVGCARASWVVPAVTGRGDAEFVLEDPTGRMRMVVPDGAAPLEFRMLSPPDGRARVGQPVVLQWSPPLELDLTNIKVTIDLVGRRPDPRVGYEWQTSNLNFKTIEVDEQLRTITFTYPTRSVLAELPMTGSAKVAIDVRVSARASACEGVRGCSVNYVKPLRAFFDAVE